MGLRCGLFGWAGLTAGLLLWNAFGLWALTELDGEVFGLGGVYAAKNGLASVSLAGAGLFGLAMYFLWRGDAAPGLALLSGIGLIGLYGFVGLQHGDSLMPEAPFNMDKWGGRLPYRFEMVPLLGRPGMGFHLAFFLLLGLGSQSGERVSPGGGKSPQVGQESVEG